jgi:hypothetical protein
MSSLKKGSLDERFEERIVWMSGSVWQCNPLPNQECSWNG